MQQIAILGAGVMGQGIAQLCAQAGYTTWLYDIDSSALERAVSNIRSALEARVAKGKLSAEARDLSLRHLHATAELNALSDADLVIEAVVEKLAVKHQLIKQLEVLCSPSSILASNTSSLSIAAIAEVAERQGRIAGLHFFNPAPVMKLVEVVGGPETSAEVCARLADFALTLGKTPVQVKDSPGFVVNRCARPFYSEALTMLEQGVATAEVIDACLKSNAGVPLGPFELMDLVGLDINLNATETIWKAFAKHPRFEPSAAIRQQVASGRLGRKSGQGFYDYPRAAKSAAPSPGLASSGGLAEVLSNALDLPVVVSDGRPLSARLGNSSGLCLDQNLLDWQQGNTALAFSCRGLSSEQIDQAIAVAADQGIRLQQIADLPGLIVQRMVSQLHREASYLLSEDVARAEDIDTALKLGLNFAMGPFEMQERVGSSIIETISTALAANDSTGRYVTNR